MKQALIIFVRNPELGKVKTRLAGTLGDEAALRIYIHLLEHTHRATHPLPFDKWVFYADRVSAHDLWEPDTYHKKVQHGADLGQRMAFAFHHLFSLGYGEVVIIGSDCPALTSEIIQNAFTALHPGGVVLGPSADGGYYLLGLTRMHNRLFEKIDWSTEKVFSQTLERCREAGLPVHLLPVLSDIDDEEGWRRYETSRQPNPTLLFVYNAGSDLFSTVTDWVHKVLSPSTYACRLCALTHTHTGMKREWAAFVSSLPYRTEFLHRDEFLQLYPDLHETELPAVLRKHPGGIDLLLPAAQLNGFADLHELEQALRSKLLPV